MEGDPVNIDAKATDYSILLVEDNAINQKVVKLMLGKFNVVPTVVDSGPKAIESVQENHFDFILMDLHMPGMDGIETVARLHELLGDDCPPVVALTADCVFHLDQDFRDSGFSGLLTKPISAETLWKCVQEHITSRGDR